MRIGIDVDGVLTNIEQFGLDYLSKYCVENNIDFNVTCSSYNIAKAFNIDVKYNDIFWSEYLMYYATHEKARPFAAEVIQKLKEEGHEIYIITARWLTNKDSEAGYQMRETVKKWLLENNILYDKLVFSKAEKEHKSDEILEHKIDIMIEDNPNNINELSNIIPVICYNTGYNIDCASDKIIRCYSWYDIYRTIKQNFKQI